MIQNLKKNDTALTLKRLKKHPTLSFFLILFIALSSSHVYASFFGESGGIKNESSFPVRVKLISKSGDYQWMTLASGASYDFSDDIGKVMLIDSMDADSRSGFEEAYRVFLIHGDGSSQRIEKFNFEYMRI